MNTAASLVDYLGSTQSPQDRAPARVGFPRRVQSGVPNIMFFFPAHDHSCTPANDHRFSSFARVAPFHKPTPMYVLPACNRSHSQHCPAPQPRNRRLARGVVAPVVASRAALASVVVWWQTTGSCRSAHYHNDGAGSSPNTLASRPGVLSRPCALSRRSLCALQSRLVRACAPQWRLRSITAKLGDGTPPKKKKKKERREANTHRLSWDAPLPRPACCAAVAERGQMRATRTTAHAHARMR
jgi:hypothetical protein